MGDLTGRVSLSAQGAEDWKRLAKRLRAAGRGDLRKELRKRIADAGRPAVEEVKAAVQAIPVTSHGGGTARRAKYAALVAGRRAQRRGGNVRSAAAKAFRRPHGLRRDVAAATRMMITARGVRIIVDVSKLPESQRTLPRHLDSAKGWRHPVFGNKNNWVGQKGRPYFASTIQRRAPQIRQAVLDGIAEIGNQIEG